MGMSTKENSVVEAISAYGPARSTIKGAPLSPEELEKIDAYWRASLYPVQPRSVVLLVAQTPRRTERSKRLSVHLRQRRKVNA